MDRNTFHIQLKDIYHVAETLGGIYNFPLDLDEDQKLTGEQAVKIIETFKQWTTFVLVAL
jgi:hypothetical protein